jgi:hypothetical protein
LLLLREWTVEIELTLCVENIYRNIIRSQLHSDKPVGYLSIIL